MHYGDDDALQDFALLGVGGANVVHFILQAEGVLQHVFQFGAEIIIEENAVTVKKRELHAPKSRLCGHNDHRVVMSLAVLCSIYGGEIDGAQAISKSYPDFFEVLESLRVKE